MTPAVSILMPVFRPDLGYLAEAIESVLAQTLAEWELVLVEDPSGTPLDALLARWPDVRIRYHRRNGQRSLAAALNDGIALCSAPMVARLDSDDLCAPERLERQLAYLSTHPDVDVIGSSLTIINERGVRIGHRQLPTTAPGVAAALRRFNCVAHPSVMFRKEVVRDCGGYDPAVAIEDYDLWCRLSSAGRQIANLPEELLRYRYHSGALKFESVHHVIRETIRTKRRYFANSLTMGDRLRIAGEYSLLALPPRVVLRLFRLFEYGASSK